jgi:hypothetical protein
MSRSRQGRVPPARRKPLFHPPDACNPSAGSVEHLSIPPCQVVSGAWLSSRRHGRTLLRCITHPVRLGGKEPDMFDKIADFLGDPIVLTILILVLLGLVGLYFYLQRRKSED